MLQVAGAGSHMPMWHNALEAEVGHAIFMEADVELTRAQLAILIGKSALFC